MIEDSPSDSRVYLAPAVFVEVEKTRIGTKLRNLFATTSITIIMFLPMLAYLGTVAAAGHISPNYCNIAGGCPWKT